MITTKSRVFRFADVTVHEREFSLIVAGRVQPVEPKAFQVLLILIRNPTKLITKEELLNEVWADAAVTENSLARNVALLRRLLGDDAREPRFIETVSGIGYRFICPVEAKEDRDEVANGNAPEIVAPNGRILSAETGHATYVRREAHRGKWPLGLTISGLLAALAVSGIFLVARLHRTPIPSRAAWVQITNFPDSASGLALSPDGHMIAFVRGTARDTQIYVKMLPDGDPVPLTHDALPKSNPSFSPDGSRIAYTTKNGSLAWDEWVVPVLGGEPHQILANASGLTWVDQDRVMFSTIKSGVRMGVVTAKESRIDERWVYLPAGLQGMAHYSWLSPDGKRVLVAEMDYFKMLPCRVVPFDGSSSGYRVGPETGGCISGAWSRDGRTIYLSVNTGDGYHVWRQRSDGGAPEQITFGPTEEQDLAVSPDGHWLLISAGIQQSTVWIHDARGDRQVSGEGFATVPGLGWGHHWGGSTFSPDGRRLYYLAGRHDAPPWVEGQLYVADLETGQAAPALPGVEMGNFDLASDGTRVTFETSERDGSSHAWVAWLDRRVPPKLLIPGVATDPHFGPGGEIFLFVPQGGVRVMYRVGSDGVPIKVGPANEDFIGFSPRGDWLIEQHFDPIAKHYDPVTVRPVLGGVPHPVCTCGFAWGPDTRFLYFRFRDPHQPNDSKTFAIASPPDQELPPLPPGGFKSPQDLKGLKAAAEIDSNGMGFFVPGPDPSIYAYERRTTIRNLFRIPLN